LIFRLIFHEESCSGLMGVVERIMEGKEKGREVAEDL
jgi:hypothetical protein